MPKPLFRSIYLNVIEVCWAGLNYLLIRVLMTYEGFATEQHTKPVLNESVLGSVFKSRRRLLYPGGPWVSSVGFGTYRIGVHPSLGFPQCADALEYSMKEGVNLIDTSTNYGDGQSEILIGRTLKKNFENGLMRQEICVVSKIGYVQGQTMEFAESRKQMGAPFLGMCELSKQVWHCIHPEFIIDQISRSLERLQLKTLDVLLLHNPEYFLRFAQMKGGLGLAQPEAMAEFEKVLFESFVCLEKLVQEGKIKCYGVSSNTLGYAVSEPTSTSLVMFLNVALKAANFLGLSESHFKVVQCPLNWMEVLPALSEIDGANVSTLEYAQNNGVGVLVNRPFNAMANGGLVRLTRPFNAKPELLSPEELKGYENWNNLSRDLEFLASKFFKDPGFEEVPLQESVLTSLMWLPGVSSVLCGMRQIKYVDDAISAAQRPALLNAYEILYKIYENLEFHRA
jgi:aryl-alcohol dehydrogenase-like predicted oxidoreductase